MSLLPSGLTGLPVFDIDTVCDALAGPGYIAVRLTDTEIDDIPALACQLLRPGENLEGGLRAEL